MSFLLGFASGLILLHVIYMGYFHYFILPLIARSVSHVNKTLKTVTDVAENIVCGCSGSENKIFTDNPIRHLTKIMEDLQNINLRATCKLRKPV